MTQRVWAYNPRETEHATLERILVAREPLLTEVLDDLRRQAQAPTRQHWLLRGARGMGKSHFVSLLYHRVRRDEALSKAYFPVWLSEAAAYSVFSAGTCLIEIARKLAEELEAADRLRSNDLRQRMDALPADGDDEGTFEGARELLKDAARSQGRVLLVLVENLDALLDSFSRRLSKPESQRLRLVLSHDAELLFVSTTPTQYLAHTADADEPLFAHLKERALKPLTEDETADLFERVCGALGGGSAEETRIRARVIHQLSGGNPRTVVMAAEVVTKPGGIREVVGEVRALLDQHTPYFEGQLRSLAPRESAIVTAMSLAPENVTLKDLAKLTRLPEKGLSTQVQRLIQEGYLEHPEGEGGKGALVGVRDGMFRLWTQYRRGRVQLEPLVRFLAMYYPPDELRATLRAMQDTAREAVEHDLARRRVELACELAESQADKLERKRLWRDAQFDPKAIAEASVEELDRSVELLQRRVATTPTTNLEQRSALAGIGLKLCLRVEEIGDRERLATVSAWLLSWCADLPSPRGAAIEAQIRTLRLLQYNSAPPIADALADVTRAIALMDMHGFGLPVSRRLWLSNHRARILLAIGRGLEARKELEIVWNAAKPDLAAIEPEVLLNTCSMMAEAVEEPAHVAHLLDALTALLEAPAPKLPRDHRLYAMLRGFYLGILSDTGQSTRALRSAEEFLRVDTRYETPAHLLASATALKVVATEASLKGLVESSAAWVLAASIGMSATALVVLAMYMIEAMHRFHRPDLAAPWAERLIDGVPEADPPAVPDIVGLLQYLSDDWLPRAIERLESTSFASRQDNPLRLLRHIQDVLAATRDTTKLSGARRKRALARVPAELRTAVRDHVARITAARPRGR